MQTDHDLQLGPLAIIALQRLSNKKFDPWELLPRVRAITSATLIWQIEDWPYARTVTFVGASSTYTLKLPRKVPCGNGYLSAASAKLTVEPKYGYREHELLRLIAQLTSY